MFSNLFYIFHTAFADTCYGNIGTVTQEEHASECANYLFNNATTSYSRVASFSETVLDRAVDVLFAYWPTILVVAVTIGVAFFLIHKAMSAVRGHI